ncbi:MAG: SMC-Scp complex subunit ScpB [Candidatus Aenigmatarchaeota archaeon]
MINKLALLEAVLFTTDKPMVIEELEKTTKIKRDEIERLLKVLESKYSNPDAGIKLSTGGGYRLIVKEDYVAKVSHLTPHADLSRGLLRVLSIIAYHEPVAQSEIVKVVGNRTYEYTKELEERGLISSERKSRTKLLTTTQHFEEYFGAKRGEIKAMSEKLKTKDKKAVAKTEKTKPAESIKNTSVQHTEDAKPLETPQPETALENGN